MKRYLSPRVIVDGKDMGMKLVELSDDGTELRLLPFTRETHSTAYVDGCLRLRRQGGRYVVEK